MCRELKVLTVQGHTMQCSIDYVGASAYGRGRVHHWIAHRGRSLPSSIKSSGQQ